MQSKIICKHSELQRQYYGTFQRLSSASYKSVIIFYHDTDFQGMFLILLTFHLLNIKNHFIK